MIKPKLDKDTLQILSLLNQNKIQQAFNLIVDLYNQCTYWHIRRITMNHDDANDVLQNTYIKVWKSLSKFKGNSNFYSWLYRIATNEALTFIKKQKKQPISIETISVKENVTNSQTDLLDGNAIQKKLELAIMTLPAKQRAVFNLKYFEELKYTEIAEITSTSVGALKASYHLAVKKIESFLTK